MNKLLVALGTSLLFQAAYPGQSSFLSGLLGGARQGQQQNPARQEAQPSQRRQQTDALSLDINLEAGRQLTEEIGTQFNRGTQQLGTQGNRITQQIGTQFDRGMKQFGDQTNNAIKNLGKQLDRGVEQIGTQGDRMTAQIGKQFDRGVKQFGEQANRVIERTATEFNRGIKTIHNSVHKCSELALPCCLRSGALIACGTAAAIHINNPTSCLCCPSLICAACLTASPHIAQLLKNPNTRQRIREQVPGPVKEAMDLLFDAPREHQD